MSFISTPPSSSQVLQAHGGQLAQLFAQTSTAEVQEVVRTANQERYFHWDKFRYLTLPPNVTHEVFWAYLKLVRAGNQKITPLHDTHGKAFTYWIPDCLLKGLNEIDRWAGQVIGSDQPSLPSTERYVISSLMEEAIATSQLEGAETTHAVAKEMLRTGRQPKNASEQMIVNNWLIIQHLRNHRSMVMTPEALREIHRIISENTLDDPSEAGRFRERDDIVVRYRDRTVHVPPPHAELPRRIDSFCKFANEDSQDNWIHPVLKGIMLHFWLAYDHPFTDGNGRSARAIFYWYMFSRKYWLFEYLAISRYFRRAAGQYVEAYLKTETDDGDLNYFLDFNLRAIRLAFRDLQEYLVRKQQEFASSAELLRAYKGLNARQKTLLAHAIRHPQATYTIEVHKNTHGVAYDTARMDLMRLASAGFIRQDKQGKEFVFSPSGKIMDRLRKKDRRVP